MPLSPGTRLGSYEILSPLGAGGIGEVYRARHAKLGREPAIKVLPSVPTLMINGRDDFVISYELQQRPFFDLLGTPGDYKRHARLEGGHIPPDRLAIIEEVVGWFDRYLGRVAPAGRRPSAD